MESEFVRLSANGPYVTRLGMGCWTAGGHGWGKVKDSESIGAIRHAFERGVTFFDTADVYGLGKSERILRQALGADLASVVIASKGGVRWDEFGKVWNDSSPEYLQYAVEASLRRLDLERIPLYYLHNPDSRTPIPEAIGALAMLRDQGKIAEIGVSNVSVSQLEEALTVAPIRAVQVQFSLLQQARGDELASVCRRNDIKLVSWGALADGLLTGKFNRWTTFGEDDHRSRLPEFQGTRFLEILRRVEDLQKIAHERGVSVAQLALRWIMDKYSFACPLFGARTAGQVQDNLGAVGWCLSGSEMLAIDNVFCSTAGVAEHG